MTQGVAMHWVSHALLNSARLLRLTPVWVMLCAVRMCYAASALLMKNDNKKWWLRARRYSNTAIRRPRVARSEPKFQFAFSGGSHHDSLAR